MMDGEIDAGSRHQSGQPFEKGPAKLGIAGCGGIEQWGHHPVNELPAEHDARFGQCVQRPEQQSIFAIACGHGVALQAVRPCTTGIAFGD